MCTAVLGRLGHMHGRLGKHHEYLCAREAQATGTCPIPVPCEVYVVILEVCVDQYWPLSKPLMPIRWK